MQGSSGFSLIELLLALAIAGILLAVGMVTLHPDHFAVNQAAQVVSGAVAKTRFDAIQANRTAQFEVSTAGHGSFSICVDENDNGTCDTGEIVDTQTFATDSLPKATLSATTLTNGRFRMDRHGVPLDSVAGRTITITALGGTYARTITLSATGRATIQ
jgi:prepilin-type N-terminal cleavage/methylation domain-containing protein